MSGELDRLGHLESIIDRGIATFMEVGQALAEIRDTRLYRATHGTFESYCRDRFGFSRAHGYRLIRAATLAEMSPVGDIQNERQARAVLERVSDISDIEASWRAHHDASLAALDLVEAAESLPAERKDKARVLALTAFLIEARAAGRCAERACALIDERKFA